MISLEEFCKVIEEKIKNMKAFDNSLPLTEMSSNAIQRQDQYMNFYQKGALVSLCLDLHLRQLSNGKAGTQDLMDKLAKKYGPGSAFEDDKLFDIIAAMTFEQVRSFFHQYVEGGEKLPLKAYLGSAGIDFDAANGRVTPRKNPTAKQLSLRKSWLNQ